MQVFPSFTATGLLGFLGIRMEGAAVAVRFGLGGLVLLGDPSRVTCEAAIGVFLFLRWRHSRSGLTPERHSTGIRCEFQRFFTALSDRPGSILAMSIHLFPNVA